MFWRYFYQKHSMDGLSPVNPGAELVRLQSQLTPSSLIKDQQNPQKNEVDVYVTCIGGSIPCHRSILVFSSQKFRELLKHEDPTNLTEVQMNYKLSEMVPVIHFFYTGNVTIMSKEENNVRKILTELGCQFGDISSTYINVLEPGNKDSKDKTLQRNHLIRYKKLRNGESFDLADVKLLHPQFLH